VLQADDAVREASVTKSVPAAVAGRLAYEGHVVLGEPLADQLAPDLLDRWPALDSVPRSTVGQLLAHTSGVPNYFREESFAARLRNDPGRI
jgi:D-alanyl-D-alanine carboxypeptidase